MSRPVRLPLPRGLLAIAICGIVGTAAANAPDTGFRIMSDAEIAAHEARMATLSGAEREAYRNAEYAKLRERAAANGYLMPETPPWAGDGKLAVAAAPPASAPASTLQSTPSTDTATRHKEMRERLQSLLGGLAPQQTDGADETKTPTTADPTPPQAATGGPATAADAAAGAPTSQAPAPATAPTRTDRPVAAPPAGTATATATTTPVPSQPVRPPAPAARPGDGIAPAAAAPRAPAPANRTGDAIPPVDVPLPRPAAMAPPAAIAPPAPIAPIPRPEPPRAPEPPARAQLPVQPPQPGAASERPPMNDYREQMRARFDDYMRQRQPGQQQAAPPSPLTGPRPVAPFPHPRGPGFGPQDVPPGYAPPYPPGR